MISCRGVPAPIDCPSNASVLFLSIMSASLPSDEVAGDYKEALEDLITNDRHQIANLTMIAKENIEHAQAIARTLILHIKKVCFEVPVMSRFVLIHARLLQLENYQLFTSSIRLLRTSALRIQCTSAMACTKPLCSLIHKLTRMFVESLRKCSRLGGSQYQDRCQILQSSHSQALNQSMRLSVDSGLVPVLDLHSNRFDLQI